MYLKSLKINNFRKFGLENNTIEFVNASDYLEDDKLNIAKKTSLIVGKNNSGKTTVITALRKLINNEKFIATDFNLTYLKELYEKYITDDNIDENYEVPILEFIFKFVIDDNKKDLLTNIIPFMLIEDVNDSEIEVKVMWSPKENQEFFASVDKFKKKVSTYKKQAFNKFLELINETDFRLDFFNKNNDKIDFSLKNLMDIKIISANKITGSTCLSDSFSKIINYKYNLLKKSKDMESFDKIESKIIEINEELDDYFQLNHTDTINGVLEKAKLNEKCKAILKSDLSFAKILNNILKYEYIDGKNEVPESQFGLGYTNFMMIIAEIIDYVAQYPDIEHNSKINLIAIEEPETYMHPQMQEMFIKNVNETILALLGSNSKHINSQIILTTHSAHILNSKIHQGNSFDNISYITELKNTNCIVNICDENIFKSVGDKNQKIEYLKFLKKHIKYNVSEIFFSDAVIFVEGITEYTLLQYELDTNEKLNKYFISLNIIGGAHALVYEDLIKLLKIPCLIITDLDIQRDENEKINFLQIESKNIEERKTTNNTLKHFYKKEKIKDLIKMELLKENNLMITFQKNEINGFYSTSFEESYILTNYNNDILNETLKEIKPNVYKQVENELINNSFKMQMKLSDSKSDFANTLLFNFITKKEGNEVPTLPQYITEGLNYLIERLNGGDNGKK